MRSTLNKMFTFSSLLLVFYQTDAQKEPIQIYEDSFDINTVIIGTYAFDQPSKIKRIALDTITTSDHHYLKGLRLNTPFMDMGNPGSPLRNIIFEMPDNLDFKLGIPVFNAYFFNPNNVAFYQIDRPYTELFVSQGKAYANSLASTQQNTTLEGVFTRNLQPDMNLFMKYLKIKERGPYLQDENNITSFQTGLKYGTSSSKWNSALIYTFNEIERQENGGISRPDLILNDTFVNRSDIPIILDGGASRQTQYHIRLINRVRLLNTEKSTLSVTHLLSGETNTYKYYDAAINSNIDSAFYGIFAYTDRGIRSFSKYSALKNDIRATWSSSNNLTISGGINLARYSLDADITQSRRWQLQYYALLNINRGRFQWNNKLYIGAMDIAKNYHFQSNLGVDFKRFGQILLSAKSIRRRPGMVQEQLNVGQENYWNIDWPDEMHQQLSFQYQSPKNRFTFGMSYNAIRNFVYFESDGYPVLDGDTRFYQQYFIKGGFTKWSIGLNGSAYYRPNPSIKYFYTPDLFARLDIFFQRPVFNDKTTIRTGIEGYYYSDYLLPKYQPILGNFQPGNTPSGQVILADYYINLTVPQFKFFVKLTNLPDLIMPQEYYWAENNPLHDWSVRFGIRWTYFN